MQQELQNLHNLRKKIGVISLVYAGISLLLGVLDILYLAKLSSSGALLVLLLILIIFRILSKMQKKKLELAVKTFYLKYGICYDLENLQYEPKKGIALSDFNATGWYGMIEKNNWLSREHITGNIGAMDVEIADIDFSEDPHQSQKLLHHVTGCFIKIDTKQNVLPLKVETDGQTPVVYKDRELEPLFRELGRNAKNGIIIQSMGTNLHILLRGRIIGFRTDVRKLPDEKSVRNNFFKEIHLAISLAKKLSVE